MKKILTHLTGIVFLIAILLAVGCGPGENPPESSSENNGLATADEYAATPERDPEKLTIYLKDSTIAGEMHLAMSNERRPDWIVINDLVTVVYPKDTVVWKKAEKSKINTVEFVHIKEVYGPEFSDSIRLLRGLHELIIPDSIKPGIIIYEIGFTVKKSIPKDTIYIIDPYLRLPRETLRK